MTAHPNLDHVIAMTRQPRMDYCDYLAARIRNALTPPDPECIIGRVGRVLSDLDPVGGWWRSSKKTLEVTDTKGTKYRITVEEVAP
jgi:hypothetical protein